MFNLNVPPPCARAFQYHVSKKTATSYSTEESLVGGDLLLFLYPTLAYGSNYTHLTVEVSVFINVFMRSL